MAIIPHLTTDKSTSQSNTSTQQSKMKNLAIALFSTLLAFSNASFWEAGPCPAKPEVVTPFEAEKVKNTYCDSNLCSR